MAGELKFEMTIPGGKRYALRDDGYRVYARLLEPPPAEPYGGETCVFEYKHSDCDDAHNIVAELLLRAAIGRERDAVNSRQEAARPTQGYEPDQTPMSVSASWKSDGTGFRDDE